ncbi:MAG: hypothetical protein LUH07_11115 [Lachnospiraceae bacterium]|nr:hypothetical protein [Lachnospiraceae bacterium]
MGKIKKWAEAVIANNHQYAPMAGVDIKKSADRLFEKEETEKDKSTVVSSNDTKNK